MTQLADELALVAAQHGSGLSEAGVLGAFVLVLGQIAGTIVRDGRADFESLTAFLSHRLKEAVLDDFRRRSLIH
jgi:hypothetical protein